MDLNKMKEFISKAIDEKSDDFLDLEEKKRKLSEIDIIVDRYLKDEIDLEMAKKQLFELI